MINGCSSGDVMTYGEENYRNFKASLPSENNTAMSRTWCHVVKRNAV